MNVTAEHAGGAVVLELDEGCRSVAALRRIVSAALPDVREDGFDVTVQGRAVEDVDVCGLEEGATIQVVESRRVVALDALRAVGRAVSKGGLEDGIVDAMPSGDVALCEQYLDAGVSPDQVCTNAVTSLTDRLIWHAFAGASLAVCELLLSRGCDVNAAPCGPATVTPLHVAAVRGLPELCALLLQHGALVDRPATGSGVTPLHVCLQNTQRHHAVREVLLSHGADMRATNNTHFSPLDYARSARKTLSCSRFNAYDQFVKYGAPKLRIPNPDGRKYTRYIQKLAKVQFKKRKQQITWEGMGVVNAFVADVLERLGGEAGRVTSFSGAKTLSVRSVVAAVKLQLPEELATHALAAGTAAVGRYAKACGGR